MSEEVLIVGGGGREHALGWKLDQSPEVQNVTLVPEGTDLATIGEFALAKSAFVVVSQDQFLFDGAVDYLKQRGVLAFGPTKAAAQLESSKASAAIFKLEKGIPSPKEEIISSYATGKRYIRQKGWSEVVIKADGPAKGKGVVVPESLREADEALYNNLVERQFGPSSELVVIQERLEGPELSNFTLTDGVTQVKFPAIRDYKRLLDGNKGPNTGGMGADGPIQLDPELVGRLETSVTRPTIEGMAEDGNYFAGMLYEGLILTKDGPKVIEYNVRFGDPECQVQMLLIAQDLYPLLLQSAQGELSEQTLRLRPGYACSVALTAKGYPGKSEKDQEIFGVNEVPEDVHVFLAGTKQLDDGRYFTTGGRIAHIASHAETPEEAHNTTYSVIGEHAVHFAGMHYRTDIAKYIA